MGAILCCLRGPDDEAPGCFLCLPWPFFLNNSLDAGAAPVQGRVAPVQGRVPLAGSGLEEDSVNTFRRPPRPLPYDDPQFIRQMEQHPLIEESNNADISTARTAEKARTEGEKIGGTQVDVPCDCQDDDCPICLEEYDYENPKVELQCNHDFHLGCIYEWMERSQSCPICAKVMLFHEDQ
ncbi:unnamed protein product [Alopecurus aequalis]